MKNLNRIDKKFYWYKKFVENKDDGADKNRLENLANQVQNNYRNYDYHFNANGLINIPDSTYRGRDYTVLKECYSKSSTLSKLKKEIYNNQNAQIRCLCQYCCGATPLGNLLDHYLPKSEYPEFSVLSLNLLPCCSYCNNLKSENWKDGNNRIIINYYFDNLENIRFLFCRIDGNWPDLYIRYYLNNPGNSISGSLYSIITSHFEKLNLIKRLSDISNSYIWGVKNSLENHVRGKFIIDAQTELLEDSQSLKQIYGNNYWKAVLYEGLSVSTNFLNSLIL